MRHCVGDPVVEVALSLLLVCTTADQSTKPPKSTTETASDDKDKQQEDTDKEKKANPSPSSRADLEKRGTV